MSAPWPFAQWGLDIVGPFPITILQLKLLIIGIDYFTKWVKEKPLAIITEKNVLSFIQKSIIWHFRIRGSSSPTMESNSTMTHLEISANSWGSRTITPPLLTLRPTDKLKSQTDPYLRWSRLNLRGKRAYGQKSYLVSCGHIGRRFAHLQERHLSASHTSMKLSSRRKWDWPTTKYPTMMKEGTKKGCAYS